MPPNNTLESAQDVIPGLATLSSGQRVEQYLEAEFSRPHVKGGTRLPTIRQLATHLNVSPTTVNAVFQKLAKDGHIHTRGKAGTFLIAVPRRKNEHLSIAVGAPLGEDAASDAWVSQIGFGVFRAAVRANTPITLFGLPSSLNYKSDLKEKLLADRRRADGLILFPMVYFASENREEVCASYERDRKS